MANDKIVIDIHQEIHSADIGVPGCHEFTSGVYGDNIRLLHPVLKAVLSIGMFPLTDAVKRRLTELVGRIDFKNQGWELSANEQLKAKRTLDNTISELKRLDSTPSSIYDFSRRLPMAEPLLGNALCPEDFTLQQQLTIARTLSGELVERMEAEFISKHCGRYSTTPPVYLVSENCSLKEWESVCKARTEVKMARFVNAETAARSIDRQDWSRLGFIFGDKFPIVAKIVSAELMAVLNLAFASFKEDLGNNLHALAEAGKIGAMRDNGIEISSLLLDKFKVSIHISDAGIGTRISGSAAGTVQSVTDTVIGVATLAALPFACLFGGKKR